MPSKDILFSVSLPPFSCPVPAFPDSSKTLALYKSHTYLLTYVLGWLLLYVVIVSPHIYSFKW